MDSEKRLFPFWRLAVFLAVILAVAGLVALAVRFLAGPSSSGQPAVKVITNDPPVGREPRELAAKHFLLEYENGLDTVSDISGNDRTAKEVYRLSNSGIAGRRTLVITIKPLPPDSFEGESSYLLRNRDPDKYTRGTYAAGSVQFTTFEQINGNELTGFLSGGGNLAILAYTVSAPGADPKAEFESLLDGFAWVN